MAVGANSVRPPLFAYMVCTNSPPATPRNGTSYFCKAEIALLPYRYSGKFLPPQNRSALCGFYFVLVLSSVWLCHFSLLIPHSIRFSSLSLSQTPLTALLTQANLSAMTAIFPLTHMVLPTRMQALL